jgi:hypothetical protein
MQKNIYFVILSLDKYLIVHKTKQNWISYLANTLMMKNIRQIPGGGGVDSGDTPKMKEKTYIL